MGYAWVTRGVGENLTWHNGETGGFASILILDREKHPAVLIFSNTASLVDAAATNLIPTD